MRFLLLVTSHSTAPTSPERRQRVMQRTEEDIAAGKLVAKGGLGRSATAATRVSAKDGAIAIEDPPAGEGWMKAGGYSIIEVASKEAAIAEATKTLEAVGDGVIELIEVSAMYPPH